ncbi:pentapeptide MXKDX repeat protein [Paraburkholderia terrae]|uniref:pentapeptide MXKDX repeat protein n=1 Tax=Paraburkholderia terrae TaxID=311230 RepID=UPI00296B503A|nr:pentapeptide MXKDX repeat protein [Paraburkholderia terrae]MDW3659785.1 pentapeptide MXKDX repeat protein [Paraburkholderia terrae]
MKKVIVAALAAVFTIATTAAFAQASGAMSSGEMASGTMAKEPMSKDTMKKGKTKHSKMKKDSGATGMKPEASGTMGQ